MEQWQRQELFIRSIEVDWSKVAENSYLYGIKCIRNLRKLDFQKPITFFVGENGSGKSTLLEAIAIAYGFNPEGGTKNYAFSTFDSHSKLYQALTLAKGYKVPKWGYFLRAESFYNVATKEEDYTDIAHPSQKYHEKSHGESSLALLQANLQREGLYFLDEPEAALSPQRQLSLLCEIIRYARQGSQFVVATHSPILLGIPDCEIISFDGESLRSCSYEETESYQVTEMFVNHRERLLRQLLEE